MQIVKPIILTCLLISQGYLFSQPLPTSEERLLTLDQSMEIAGQNSPAIQKSRYNMEKNKEYLNAQLASLKSNFFLNITPASYSKGDVYDEIKKKY